MAERLFPGRVLGGGLLILDAPKDYARHVRAHAGQYVEIVLRKRRTKRSSRQNAYIHAVPIPILADHFGYTVPEMKLVLMGECWGWKPDPVSGHEIPIRSHSAGMTVAECQFFIDWVIPWAMTNHGVMIPLPNEVDVSSWTEVG